MNKTVWIVGAVLLVAALAGAYTFITHHDQEPTPHTEQGTGNAVVGANGASSIITYTDAGFDPSPLTVAVGTTVTWTNQSSRTLWIEDKASKGNCPDTTSLNECKAIIAGGSYSYTFTAPGTTTYFNHEHAADLGTILVTAAGTAGPINPNALPQ